MAASLAVHMREKGVALISPDVGATMFADELVLDANRCPEITIGGGSENIANHAGSSSRRMEQVAD